MREWRQQNRKKMLSALLVMVLILTNVFGVGKPMITLAGTLTSNKENLLDGTPFSFYGKEHRTSMFHWGHKDGVNREQSAFCIEPSKEMYSGMVLSDRVYGIGDDFSEVGIDSEEQFQAMCMVLQWCGAYQGSGKISNDAYIVAQGALFALMTGHTLDGEFKSEMGRLKARIKNASYREKFDSRLDSLMAYMEGNTKKNPLPEGIGVNRELTPVQAMEETEDGYVLSFDISGCRELKDVTWEFPGDGWSKKISGTLLRFVYKGTDGPSGTIVGTHLPAALQSKIPREGEIHVLEPNFDFEQTLITGFVPSGGTLYINLSGSGKETPEEPVFEVRRHKETFEANYHIRLEKKDAETGKALENTVFEVLEAFDRQQLGGLLQESRMRPKPAVWEGQRVCGTMTTDEEGSAGHSDTRYYEYSKTYCLGHPEPEYPEIPEEEMDPLSGLVINGEEIAALEEECLRLEQMWEEGIALCEEEVDFHDVDGDGEDMMVENRDATYERFIQLQYEYTIKEIQSRQGYILHGLHHDDKPIEVITTNASEAGADSQVADSQRREASITLNPVKNHRVLAGRATTSSATPVDATPLETPEGENESFPRQKERKAGGQMLAFREVQFPDAVDDDVDWVRKGEKDNVSHTFQVVNHRTEGEIHINKRDLELYEKDEPGSYGKTQGDATLEGAVYGLYAGTDLIHPDGKTGVVYRCNDLVAMAATDKTGDASFLAVTESQPGDGNLPEKDDFVGHPLFLGNYYIKEISRSEGYELSVFGVNLTETNRKATGIEAVEEWGSASAGALSHRRNEWDGSWNDFTVKTYQTTKGYDVTLSGYPEGSTIYRVDESLEEVTEEVVTDSYLAVKTDDAGNPVYQTANGGEYKTDREGNPIPCVDGEGNPLLDTTKPETEQVTVSYRLNLYPVATPAEPTIDSEKWEDTLTVDVDYIKEEANALLEEKQYRLLDKNDGAPWTHVELSGSTNKELIMEILDWYEEHDFWDSAGVESVTEQDGTLRARLFTDYRALEAEAIYDFANDRIYVKKLMLVDGEEGYGWLLYETGEFRLLGRTAKLLEKREIKEALSFGEEIPDLIVTVYQPLYEVYQVGEILRDTDGAPIPETEMKFLYDTKTYTAEKEILTPVNAVYEKESGVYVFHVENETDWTTQKEAIEIVYRAVAPEKTIEYEGIVMAYADYLNQIVGCGADAAASGTALDAGSYIKYVSLAYPGQLQVSQDSGTGEKPVTVLQRVIKQAIKVTKDIAQDSYENVNTYRIHKDPFTVMFGGYGGKPGAKTMKDFYFRLYAKRELETTGHLEYGEDGEADYEKLFTEHPEYVSELALDWDNPAYNKDGDLTTIHADRGSGKDGYYGTSIPLPYGTYVLAEQQPDKVPQKHYQIDRIQEIVLPFVPKTEPDGTVHESEPSPDYLYDGTMTMEEMTARFGIRFGEETHVIRGHNHSGDFDIYKYGLRPDAQKPDYVGSSSEQAGIKESVYYDILYNRDGTVADYGVTLSNVPTMTGASTAVDLKYSAALVPWSVLTPVTGGPNHREPGVEADGSFNYIGFAGADMENRFYSSKIRIEKLDSETGEPIVHDGALFKIYAAKRDISGGGTGEVTGSGEVLYQTFTVTGTRAELEARGDTEHIRWNPQLKTYTGTVTIPDYDPSEYIQMTDMTGKETGIFRAYSTVKEVLQEDGSFEKVPVGYIETYQPLGAGVYVLVEVQAPEGYQKSKPVAFQVYSDRVEYYRDGQPNGKTRADRYQYAVPVAGGKPRLLDLHEIPVKDAPSKAVIHKVESGDNQVGDVNGLGSLTGINDKGDLLTYEVRGRKEYLEAREDVEHIVFDETAGEYKGTVTKTLEEWSEHLIAGTEEELRLMEQVKVLYDKDSGAFSGYGIRFDIYVKDARLALYKGLEIRKVADHVYHGITVKWSQNKIVAITASATGEHLEITTQEKDTQEPWMDIWDANPVGNPPVALFYYDLDEVPTKIEEATGELWVLDERGNKICYADSISGMAYVYDEYGRMIAYQADESGGKIIAKTIDGKTVEWTTGEDAGYQVDRLPFGAYVLEETEVPYEQGYIQAAAQGLVLRTSAETQHFYMQNDFTKLNIGKVDITTGQEIQDAGMTLYKAEKVEDESLKGYHLEKGEVYTEWISGYQYDDNGNLMEIKGQEKVATVQPHWVDHIPVGDYILEESEVPFAWGYVSSKPMEIQVLETAHVQTEVMEDDYTAVEIRKYDTKTGKPIVGAELSLYPARLGEDGEPLFKTTKDWPGQKIPVADWSRKLITWEPGNIQGIRQVPMTPAVLQARYFKTDTGNTRFEYLPVGHYVLVEEKTPVGYATAAPMLISVEDVGGQTKVQTWEMGDVPLILEVWKNNQKGQTPQVKGATLALYPVTEGVKGEEPLYRWLSGSDGEEEGSLKPHQIPYIPKGDYVLAEEKTPYGFLRAKDIWFSVIDTEQIQIVEMLDEIPKGIFTVAKHDEEEPEQMLSGAVFRFRNKTTGEDIETLVTDDTGKATASEAVPVGFMNEQGEFVPYTYEAEEVDAPDNYMLNTGIYEFQFPYEDETTSIISLTYHAKNRINQVKISKQILTTKEELPGALMSVTGKYTKIMLDRWISTGQPHYIYDIPEGVYILTEEATPGAGYAKAESIEFTIRDNMTEVPYIIMYDQPTIIEIEKVRGNTGEPLPGARLQLSKEDGTVVDQWTTTETAHVLYGLEPGKYLISELEAPEGYRKGRVMEIAVTDTMEVQKFFYRNYKIETEGETEIPEKPIVIGSITLKYDSKPRSGWGEWLEEAGRKLGLPNLGDNINAMMVWAGILGITGLVTAWLTRKKKGRKNIEKT